MPRYYNGVPIGGSANIEFVDMLPLPSEAKRGTIYVHQIDQTIHVLDVEVVAAVPGVVTRQVLAPGAHITWLGALDADPISDPVSAYYNRVTHQLRHKPVGSTVPLITQADVTVTTITAYNYLGELAADPTGGTYTANDFYYNTTSNNFFLYAPGTSNWVAFFGAGSLRARFERLPGDSIVAFLGHPSWAVANTAGIDTEAEVANYFLNNAPHTGTTYFYFDSTLGEIRRVESYTGPVASWSDSTIIPVTADAAALWLGPNNGQPGTDEIDSELEAEAWLNVNYQAGNHYYFYDSTSDEVQDITAYAPGVPSFDRDIFEEIGGGTLTLGPETNQFTGTTKALAETARDTYATANPTWLSDYAAEPAFLIELTYSGTVEYQRRVGTAWQNVTGLVRGQQGVQGLQGTITLRLYTNSATQPTAAPTGGSYDLGTGILDTSTLTAGWLANPTARAADESTYESIAIIDPLRITASTTTPNWLFPTEHTGRAGTMGNNAELQFSEDNSSWHDTATVDDLYVRLRIQGGAWSVGFRIVGLRGIQGLQGASISIQFSDDDSSWHDTAVAADRYIRFRIGTGSWSVGLRIPGIDGTPGQSVQIQFSEDDSSWHDTATNDDRFIRFRVGSTGAWSVGVPLHATAIATNITVQYTHDPSITATWHTTQVAIDTYYRFRVGTGNYSAAIPIIVASAEEPVPGSGTSFSRIIRTTGTRADGEMSLNLSGSEDVVILDNSDGVVDGGFFGRVPDNTFFSLKGSRGGIYVGVIDATRALTGDDVWEFDLTRLRLTFNFEDGETVQVGFQFSEHATQVTNFVRGQSTTAGQYSRWESVLYYCNTNDDGMGRPPDDNSHFEATFSAGIRGTLPEDGTGTEFRFQIPDNEPDTATPTYEFGAQDVWRYDEAENDFVFEGDSGTLYVPDNWAVTTGLTQTRMIFDRGIDGAGDVSIDYCGFTIQKNDETPLELIRNDTDTLIPESTNPNSRFAHAIFFGGITPTAHTITLVAGDRIRFRAIWNTVNTANREHIEYHGSWLVNIRNTFDYQSGAQPVGLYFRNGIFVTEDSEGNIYEWLDLFSDPTGRLKRYIDDGNWEFRTVYNDSTTALDQYDPTDFTWDGTTLDLVRPGLVPTRPSPITAGLNIINLALSKDDSTIHVFPTLKFYSTRGVQVQFTSNPTDASLWHDPPEVAADTYFRFSVDDSGTYGLAIPLGRAPASTSTDFNLQTIYRRSETEPTDTPTGTVASGVFTPNRPWQIHDEFVIPSGGYTGQWALQAAQTEATGATQIESSGRILTGNDNPTGQVHIYEYEADGTFVESWSLPSQVLGISDLTEVNNRLYVLDNESRRVWTINAATHARLRGGEIVLPDTVGGETVTYTAITHHFDTNYIYIVGHTGVAGSEVNHMLVYLSTDSTRHTELEFAIDTAITSIVRGSSSTTNRLYFLASGRIYVFDTAGNRYTAEEHELHVDNGDAYGMSLYNNQITVLDRTDLLAYQYGDRYIDEFFNHSWSRLAIVHTDGSVVFGSVEEVPDPEPASETLVATTDFGDNRNVSQYSDTVQLALNELAVRNLGEIRLSANQRKTVVTTTPSGIAEIALSGTDDTTIEIGAEISGEPYELRIAAVTGGAFWLGVVESQGRAGSAGSYRSTFTVKWLVQQGPLNAQQSIDVRFGYPTPSVPVWHAGLATRKGDVHEWQGVIYKTLINNDGSGNSPDVNTTNYKPLYSAGIAATPSNAINSQWQLQFPRTGIWSDTPTVRYGTNGIWEYNPTTREFTFYGTGGTLHLPAFSEQIQLARGQQGGSSITINRIRLRVFHNGSYLATDYVDNTVNIPLNRYVGVRPTVTALAQDITLSDEDTIRLDWSVHTTDPSRAEFIVIQLLGLTVNATFDATFHEDIVQFIDDDNIAKFAHADGQSFGFLDAFGNPQGNLLQTIEHLVAGGRNYLGEWYVGLEANPSLDHFVRYFDKLYYAIAFDNGIGEPPSTSANYEEIVTSQIRSDVHVITDGYFRATWPFGYFNLYTATPTDTDPTYWDVQTDSDFFTTNAATGVITILNNESLELRLPALIDANPAVIEAADTVLRVINNTGAIQTVTDIEVQYQINSETPIAWATYAGADVELAASAGSFADFPITASPVTLNLEENDTLRFIGHIEPDVHDVGSGLAYSCYRRQAV